jgi:hypothetical protein
MKRHVLWKNSEMSVHTLFAAADVCVCCRSYQDNGMLNDSLINH